MQPHRHHREGIAHALAGISQDLGNGVIAFEARITVFDADPLLRESTIVLFLLGGEVAFWLPLLGRFALERRGHHSLPDLQTLKATISLDRDGCLARELHLIEDLLIMLCPWCLQAYGQDALGLVVWITNIVTRSKSGHRLHAIFSCIYAMLIKTYKCILCYMNISKHCFSLSMEIMLYVPLFMRDISDKTAFIDIF